MSNRKDAVNYISLGLLLALAGVILLFLKLATSFVLVYWLIGVVIGLVGLAYIKSRPLIGIVLLVVGFLTLLGKLHGGLGKLLSVAGWLGLLGGGGMVLFGMAKVRR